MNRFAGRCNNSCKTALRVSSISSATLDSSHYRESEKNYKLYYLCNKNVLRVCLFRLLKSFFYTRHGLLRYSRAEVRNVQFASTFANVANLTVQVINNTRYSRISSQPSSLPSFLPPRIAHAIDTARPEMIKNDVQR